MRKKQGSGLLQGNSFKLMVLLLVTTLSCLQVKNTEANKHPNQLVSKEGLSNFIDSLYAVDQKAQNDVVDAFQSGISGDSIKALFAAIPLVYERHIPLLKSIVQEFGYPGPELVGKESAHNFFIMIQHSDSDLDFQSQMLRTIEEEVQKGNVEEKDYAFLTDRVLLAKGEEQLYGTQVEYNDNGNAFPKNLYKPDECNKRRAELGMETLENYLKMLDEVHQNQNARND